MTPNPGLSTFLRRWLARLAIVAVATEILYLIAANVFLNTSLAPSAIVRKPEKLTVEWRRAWTPLPGIVSVRDVRVRAQNRRLQWSIRLERAWVTVDLPALPRKRFHVYGLSGSGLELWMRSRLDALEPRPAEAASLLAEAQPPIPGLENPPRPAPEELYPPRRTRRPWRLDFDRFDVGEVRDVWIDAYRLRGAGRLAGSFRFEIRGDLEVERAEVAYRGAGLTVGGEPVSGALDAEAEIEVDSFDVGELGWRGFLSHLSGGLEIAAGDVGLGFLDRYLRGAGWIDVSGRGALDAELAVAAGELRPPSRVDVDAPRIAVRWLDNVARGAGRIRARIEESDGTTEGVVEVTLDEFGITGGGRERPHVEGEGLELALRTSRLALDEPVGALSARLHLPESRVPDLTVYNALLPAGAGFALSSGSATLRADLETATDAGPGGGEIELRGRGVEARFGDVALHGNLHLLTRLREADLDARRFDLAGTRLELDGVGLIENGHRQDAGWWARLDLREGVAEIREPLELDARVALRMRDSRPLVALFVSRKRMLRWFDDLLTVEDVAATAALELADDALAVRDLELHAEKVEILAQLRLAQKRRDGILFVKYGPFAAGLELDRGDADWKLYRPRRWYERQRGRR